MSKEEASVLILRELSSGNKTSEELKEACCVRAGIVESTYYYHLKQLIEKLGEVEEISERDIKGRLIKKYALKKEEKKSEDFQWISYPSGSRGFVAGGLEILFPPDRSLLELAAWIKHDPASWKIDNLDVKKAKQCLEHTPNFVPDLTETSEDPDSYAFVWPDEYLKEKKIEGIAPSRFFNYKSVYDSLKVGVNSGSRGSVPVFLGAFCSIVNDEPVSVIVALRKEGPHLQVTHIECQLGKLNKTWVKAVSNQLKANSENILPQEKLKDTIKRKLLLSLKDTVEKNILIIPNKYTQLIEDLLEFSYNGPVNGYVLALALAVQNAIKK